jgi:IS30 family transposase
MKRPVDFKNNNKAQAWTEDENATLIELWNQGWRCSDIAAELGKTKSSVANYLSRNRQWLKLEKRSRHYKPARKPITELVYVSKLDREWHGVVPLKHWTITQKWSRG